MKKVLLWMFLCAFTLSGLPMLYNVAIADSGNAWFTDNTNWRWTQEMSYNAGVAGSDSLQKDELIHVVKRAINWVLWMLSLVALAIALYAGFLMMTSGGDEKKYQKWVGLLKWAGIWLAIIALSWLIVSLIFWVINGAIGDWGSWWSDWGSWWSDSEQELNNG